MTFALGAHSQIRPKRPDSPAMASIRVRTDSGKLFLDFRVQGVRCRELTELPDTEETGPSSGSDILDFRAKLAAKPRHRKGETLSAARVNTIMMVLEQVLEEGADRYDFVMALIQSCLTINGHGFRHIYSWCWKVNNSPIRLGGEHAMKQQYSAVQRAMAYAYLGQANLAGANLTNAVLVLADLNRANLPGAKLSGARWIDGRICGEDHPAPARPFSGLCLP